MSRLSCDRGSPGKPPLTTNRRKMATDVSIFNAYTNVTYSPADQDQIDRLAHINKIFMAVSPICLLAFGAPGNVLSIMVLSRSTYRENIFSIYLISLCFFNIITLVFAMPRLLGTAYMGTEIVSYHPGWCRLTKWLTYSLMTITSWHLVIITGCRLLYLTKSLRHFSVCLRPQINILIMVVVVCLCVAFVVYNDIVTKSKTGYTIRCYLDISTVGATIQFILYCVGPALLIIIFNSAIVFIHRGKKSGLASNKSSDKVRSQLLILGFVTSLMFVVTLLPVSVLYGSIQIMVDLNTKLGQAKGRLAVNVTVILLYSNNATNFLVYCFFGKRFRMDLMRLLKSRDTYRPSLALSEESVFHRMSQAVWSKRHSKPMPPEVIMQIFSGTSFKENTIDFFTEPDLSTTFIADSAKLKRTTSHLSSAMGSSRGSKLKPSASLPSVKAHVTYDKSVDAVVGTSDGARSYKHGSRKHEAISHYSSLTGSGFSNPTHHTDIDMMHQVYYLLPSALRLSTGSTSSPIDSQIMYGEGGVDEISSVASCVDAHAQPRSRAK